MAPSQEHRKDLMPVLADRLSRPVSGGFRLMRFPQHGSPLLPAAFYSDEPDEPDELFEKSCEINAAILQRRVGKGDMRQARIEAGREGRRTGRTLLWPARRDNDRRGGKAVSTAVAEWLMVKPWPVTLHLAMISCALRMWVESTGNASRY